MYKRWREKNDNDGGDNDREGPFHPHYFVHGGDDMYKDDTIHDDGVTLPWELAGRRNEWSHCNDISE